MDDHRKLVNREVPYDEWLEQMVARLLKCGEEQRKIILAVAIPNGDAKTEVIERLQKRISQPPIDLQ